MPQANKSVSGAGVPGQVSAPDRGEPPPPPVVPDARSQEGAGDCQPAAGVAELEQGDPQIIKSPSDPKKYRYIELSNGLRALLISDFSGAEGKGSGEDTESQGEEEVDEGQEEEEEEDSGEGTEEEENDGEEADSDFEELDEEKEGKKKRGSCEKQSAAALCISVGSFSDPDDLPGLAHFLEHMVFMGSEKYPAENGFDAFLKKHGGSDNASTDCERTIFQFDVQRKYFREALDRWAQFFICPLMIEDAIDREVEAVDSEYQLARPSDSHRKEMLFGSLAKPGHPMSKFCWGNAQTLKHEPREQQINTYQRLRDFWKRYYSAHYMTLTVQSKETLDTLEEWVREIFISVPNNGEPRPDFSDLQQPFDTPAFNKLYRVRDVRLLILEHCRWSVVQKYEAVMKGLTVDDLMTFVTGLKAELYTEGLVQGNFTSTESMEFLQYFIDKLQFQPLSVEVPVLFRVVELPQKHHLCKVKSLNKGDANSEVTVYYQSGLKNLREHTLMELMVMHMEEPCFDFLRTKETLGYQVYPTCRNTSGVLGFSVTVETQATKFSTDFVEGKIEEFLVSFGERLSGLSEEGFKTQVTALIKLKECEDAHLGEEVDRNWFEVVTQQYVFDRLNKEIEALKLITQEELVSWFLQHRDAGSRKLSVHVVGFGTEENDPPDQSPSPPDTPATSTYGEVSKLTFLAASSSLLQDAALITDIREFTSSLPLHPYHKILS
ncbi:nardilysin b [Myripristis murdjan]|uniref:nardilysin b n=1 Tax=Myripristis murdjan TaxID=586833 RepID=UPI00117609B5|nr:nardilysin-like [Myripristis murdjan]